MPGRDQLPLEQWLWSLPQHPPRPRLGAGGGGRVASALPSGSSACWRTRLRPPKGGLWPSPGTEGPQGMARPFIKPGSPFLANAEISLAGSLHSLPLGSESRPEEVSGSHCVSVIPPL